MEWVFGDHVTEYTEAGENTYSYGDRFKPNDMYFDEMHDFLSCIKNDTPPDSSLENAVHILKIALIAKKEMPDL